MIIAYRGSSYHGWQTQTATPTEPDADDPAAQNPPRELPTVQKTLTRALIAVLRHPVTVTGSSRTDSGVHAKGQVAHFDTDQTQIPPEGLRRAANARLPADILIRSIQPVAPDFDAISSTTSKRYQYYIWNAPDRPPFFPELIWHRWQPLDIDAMRSAASQLVGTYDFASFARPGHGRASTIRTVHACDVSFRLPRLVIGIQGTGFLWNMVRIIAGTLVEVGIGRYGPQQLAQILAARDRRAAGPTAPPQGLYLQWVKYHAATSPQMPVPSQKDRPKQPHPHPQTVFGE